MKLREISSKTGFPLGGLEHAATRLNIESWTHISQSNFELMYEFLVEAGVFSAESLQKLENFTVIEQEPKKVKFLAGEGFHTSFLQERLQHTDVLSTRQTRNCGDTAALIAHHLVGVIKIDRDVPLTEFLAALKSPASQHEVWQPSIHQHTFTIERHPRFGNRLIQSYQATIGTYNVQYWCGLDDAFIDADAVAVCEGLSNNWFEPTHVQLAQLADMMEEFYGAEKLDRGDIWKLMPFHPGDVGRILETEEVAFTTERILLGNAGFPATMIALQKGLQ